MLDRIQIVLAIAHLVYIIKGGLNQLEPPVRVDILTPQTVFSPISNTADALESFHNQNAFCLLLKNVYFI